MEVILACCAHSHSVDRRTNNVSIFNIVEEMAPAGFPAASPEICFVVIARKEKDSTDTPSLRLSMMLDADVLAEGPFALDFQGKLRARGIAEIGGLIITKPGILTLRLFEKKKLLASWVISIRDAAQPTITSDNKPTSKSVVPKSRKHRRLKKSAKR